MTEDIPYPPCECCGAKTFPWDLCDRCHWIMNAVSDLPPTPARELLHKVIIYIAQGVDD